MNKWSPILTFFIFVTVFGMFVLVYLFVSPFLPSSSSNAKEWKQQVEKLRKENNNLKANAKADAKNVEELKANLSASKKEVEELKAKLSASEKENKKPTKQLEDKTTGDDSYLISLFFKKAKYPYEMRDKSFEFYSDPSCEEKYLIKEDLTFTGWQDYPLCLDLEAGETNCYVSYSYEKGPVFSKPEDGHPSFNAIK